MEARLVDLEIRLAHQEAAIEALTAADLARQREVQRLRQELDDLKRWLREIGPGGGGDRNEPEIPPHY